MNGAINGLVAIQETPIQILLLAKPEAGKILLASAMRLGAILIKYGTENDALSKNLLLTGHTFMIYAVENHGKPVDELLKETILKIADIQKALKNPFGIGMFKEPWLIEGSVTWDKSTLDEYQNYVSRFSDKVIEAVPHQFAMQVLEWMPGLALESETKEIEVIKPSVLPKDVLDYQRFMQYEHLIEQSKKLEEKLNLIKQLETMNEVLEKANSEGFKRFEATLVRQELSQQQQTAELKRGLDSIQAQQQKTVSLYKQATAEAEATTSQVKKEIAAANIKMSNQQIQISSLYSQLQSAHNQLGAMQHELNNSGNDCQIM